MVGKRAEPTLEEAPRELQLLCKNILKRCSENESNGNLSMKIRIVDARTLVDSILKGKTV